jgi:uncharacterized protein (TIGR03435 family)
MSHLLRSSLLAAALAGPALVTAQDATSQNVAFDVASVKESRSLELDGFFRSTPGRFTVTNLSVRWILRYAFRLRDYQVIDAPAWTETRYDVDARFSDGAATDEHVRGMLQRLLVDRFALKARHEQRPIRLYELRQARAGGAVGPKLILASKACDAKYCLFQTAWFIKGFSRTLPQLTQALDSAVGSPVVDRTGLAGAYDFDITWGAAGDVARDPSLQSPDEFAALFTALREQLGLTLEPARAPYEVLVIDTMSKPTAN